MDVLVCLRLLVSPDYGLCKDASVMMRVWRSRNAIFDGRCHHFSAHYDPISAQSALYRAHNLPFPLIGQ